jgi:hypothetical protein
VALLDGGTAVIGDPALVRDAIDQRSAHRSAQSGGKSRIDAVLNDRITSLRQRYDVWGLGEQGAGFVAPMGEAKVLESADLLDSIDLLKCIDRFQFGMQLASGLELGAEIHARSPEGAEKLSAALGTMAALVKGHQTSTSATEFTTKLATKFELQADGGSLNLTVSIPEEELEKIMEAETAVLSPVSLERVGQPAAPVSAPPPEQPPTTPEPGQTAVPEAAETGPNGAPEALPVAPAVPAAVPAPAAPVAAPAPAATSEVLDKEGNTVVLTLPGKK